MDLWFPARCSLLMLLPGLLPYRDFLDFEDVSALLSGMDTSLCTQLKWQFPAIMEGNDHVRIWITLQPQSGPPSGVADVKALMVYP